MTLAHIEAEFGAEVAADVDALSRRKDAGESYENYIERAGAAKRAPGQNCRPARQSRRAADETRNLGQRAQKDRKILQQALRSLDADESEE